MNFGAFSSTSYGCGDVTRVWYPSLLLVKCFTRILLEMFIIITCAAARSAKKETNFPRETLFLLIFLVVLLLRFFLPTPTSKQLNKSFASKIPLLPKTKQRQKQINRVNKLDFNEILLIEKNAYITSCTPLSTTRPDCRSHTDCGANPPVRTVTSRSNRNRTVTSSRFH